MGEALKVLVGPDAQGLSPSTVSRLKQVWAEEYRRLSGRVKTGHLWTPQNRPFPAPETSVDLYFMASCVRKLVWTFVRQLRGPHLRMWA